ncbi:major facilitator superfamily domain-containing protein [Hygrophoropsis aurantiaca]|uniref:Major facilitator superfamily domain-containing protein n=1 Tax=Hygrophoropsis aurantiaca TaxID=72124 RepID=A0ACB8AJR4_9AGAM|nr:major facilitator superfamily domain-containing protein [Hygrophoropsis aurantiaca]
MARATVRWRGLLLLLFCLAQFLDVFNSSALFTAIASITASLRLSVANSVWLLSAYQLTFASFLLLSGRISDVYKYVFVGGLAAFGLMSLGSGFVDNQIAFLVLRALIGVAAALTIPSALALIVHMYPNPETQGRAIAAFGGSVAIGNVSGLIIGAALVEKASWRWIFWIVAMVAIPVAASVALLVPSELARGDDLDLSTKKELDIAGIILLTSSLILFIFSVTSGSSSTWKSATTLVPLFVSLLMFTAFWLWERRVPSARAALPLGLWSYPNFGLFFAVALLPMFWWTTVLFQFTTFWQEIYQWSSLKAAVHLLPIGLLAFPVMIVASKGLPIGDKSIILIGEVLTLAGSILLTFSNTPALYWSRNFVGFCIGTVGTALVFARANIIILQTTPNELAGTVSAIFNAALQLGSATGVSIISSIQNSVESSGSDPFRGRAAGLWALTAFVAAELIAVSFLWRSGTSNEISLEPKVRSHLGEDEPLSIVVEET